MQKNKMLTRKKAAVELSMSTIVIVVLAMTMLIVGIVLVRNIFSGATDIADLTTDQIINEINQMFGEEEKVVIYPSTDTIPVRQEKQSGFAIGIRNKLSGAEAQSATFSYDVIPVSDIESDCGITEEELMSLFVSGSNSDENIPIATGDPKAVKVLFNTGEGDPLCTARFRVDVKANGNNYDSTYVFIEFKD
jgi:hypothetical protein